MMNAEQEREEAFNLQEREAFELEQRVRAVVAPYFGTVNALPALAGIFVEHAMNAALKNGRTGSPAEVSRLGRVLINPVSVSAALSMSASLTEVLRCREASR